MHLVLKPIWPWPAVVLITLGLLAVVVWTYPRRVRHLPRRTRWTLIGLRVAAVLALAFAMLGPELHHRDDDETSQVFIILSDASRSMGTQDGPGGISRRQAVVQALRQNADLLEQLGEEIEIRRYDFDAELRPVERFDAKAEGQQTAIGTIFQNLLRETDPRRLARVLMLSDFAHRAAPPRDADPRDKAEDLGLHRVHVDTVLFGGTGLEGAVDAGVEDLQVDPLLYERTLVPITAKIRTYGADGRRLQVRLLVEDRSGKRPGEVGAMRVPPATQGARPTAELAVTKNEDVQEVQLSFVPQQAGEYKLAVEVVPLDGELKRGNNTAATIVTVQKGGVTIAYFDRLRPEQLFIRRLGRDNKFRLDFVPVRTTPQGGAVPIDPQLFEPDRYDAYVIGDVPAEAFGPDRLQELRDRVEDGAGLLMLGGFRSFGPGGYAGTPLEDVLPVMMSRSQRQIGDAVDPALHYRGPLEVRPTPRGHAHFLMRFAPDVAENLKRWQALPAIGGSGSAGGANRLREKNASVEILAEGFVPETGETLPLLFAYEYGRARVAALAVDTTYQWHLAGHAEAHQRFWRQMMLWLTQKELEGDRTVWARVEPRNFQPGQRATVVFGARTPDGQPLPDADFEVEVHAPDGETAQIAPRRSGEEHLADFTGTQAPGDYWVRVSASKNGTSLGPDAWTRFVVDARDLELDNPAADRALMQYIAEKTAGTSMAPEQLRDYLKRLIENPPTDDAFAHVRAYPLWDNWGFLGAFVALMSVEWFLRKRRGLV